MRHRRLAALVFGMASFGFAGAASAQAAADPLKDAAVVRIRESFKVDGIALFDPHNLHAARMGVCAPSIFSGLKWCVSGSAEEKKGAAAYIKTTGYNIDAENRIVYAISSRRSYPLKRDEFDGIVQAIGERYGAGAAVLALRKANAEGRAAGDADVNSLIAVWGGLRLVHLTEAEYAVVEAGGSLKRGHLIDHRFNLVASAKQRDPIYRIEGEAGFILHLMVTSPDRADVIMRAVYQPVFLPAPGKPSPEADNPLVTDTARRSSAPPTGDRDRAERGAAEEQQRRIDAERALAAERLLREEAERKVAEERAAIAEEKAARAEAEKKAAEARKALEEEKKRAEAERKAALDRAERAESELKANEARRAKEESERKAAEKRAAGAEDKAAGAEERAKRAERERMSIEERRRAEEAERKAAEEKAAGAEQERRAAEERAKRAETERKALEERRRKEEAERKAAEERAKRAETERKALEERRRKGEVEKKAAEERATRAEAERKTLEQRRRKEEAEKKAAEERAQRAETEKKALEERTRKDEAERKAAEEKAARAEERRIAEQKRQEAERKAAEEKTRADTERAAEEGRKSDDRSAAERKAEAERLSRIRAERPESWYRQAAEAAKSAGAIWSFSETQDKVAEERLLRTQTIFGGAERDGAGKGPGPERQGAERNGAERLAVEVTFECTIMGRDRRLRAVARGFDRKSGAAVAFKTESEGAFGVRTRFRLDDQPAQDGLLFRERQDDTASILEIPMTSTDIGKNAPRAGIWLRHYAAAVEFNLVAGTVSATITPYAENLRRVLEACAE